MNDIGFKPGEIKALIIEFESIAKNVNRSRNNILKNASMILVNEIKRRAPISSKIHKRYGTPKAVTSRRAKRGSGVVAATYYPGNLRFSFKPLKFSRSYAYFVGPKLAKGKGNIHNNSGNADGYYAGWVEKGRYRKPFVKPAFDAVNNDVRRDIIDRVQKFINRSKLSKK